LALACRNCMNSASFVAAATAFAFIPSNLAASDRLRASSSERPATLSTSLSSPSGRPWARRQTRLWQWRWKGRGRHRQG
jgi:hypothetical protein